MGLQVELDESRDSYAPGGRVRGEVSWELTDAPHDLEIRLVWQTRGIGSQNSSVVACETIAHPRSQGRQAFSLSLPWEPYSFSGKLVSVEWRVEFGNPSSDDWTFAPLVVGPDGREVDLPQLGDDDAGA